MLLIKQRRNRTVGLNGDGQYAVGQKYTAVVQCLGQHGKRVGRFVDAVGTPRRAVIAELADAGFGEQVDLRVGLAQHGAHVLGDVGQTLQIAAIVLAGFAVHPCDGRAGQDVVELVQQQRLPYAVQLLARVDVLRIGQHGGCAQVFDRAQQRFLLAAAAFHVLLRGQGATVQFEIQLALPDGHFRAGVLCKLLMRLVEEVIRLFDAHLGDAFEVLVAVQVLHHVARGAATAITETEEQKRAVGEILVLEVLLGVVEFLNLAPSSIGIRRREVGEDARAVDAFPHERVVRELGGIVPRDLLREEPFVPGTAGDLRPCAGVAEAVRQPYALGLHTEMFLEVFAAICNLADQ